MAKLTKKYLRGRFTKRELRNLISLNMQFKDINSIELVAFDKEMESLKTLSLSYNNLASLDGKLFRKLKQLEILYLHSNQIETIDAKAFENLTSLRELRLNHNLLSTIDARTFALLDQLTILTLNNNNLQTLNVHTFKSLFNLRELYLDNNNITSIPAFAFESLMNLTKLNLNQNKLTSIEANVFAMMVHLRELDLSRNQLQSVQLRSLTSLSHLNLANNRLETLHSNMFRLLGCLASLDLKCNQLTNIDERTFEHLKSLKVLSLSSNRLTNVSSRAFCRLDELVELYLHSNQLTSIDRRTFESLSKLKYLWLNDNRLKYLEGCTFDSLHELTHLRLDNNRISNVESTTFHGLHNLLELYMDNNQLKFIKLGTFDDQRNLDLLTLDYNELSESSIDEKTFVPLKSIKIISLFNNSINIDSFVQSNYFNNFKYLLSIGSPSANSTYIHNFDRFLDQFKQFKEIDCSYLGRKLKKDRYQIKSFIGNGSYGRVYLAYDDQDKVEKAIKVLYQSDENEIDLLRKLDSDLIVKYTDHFHDLFTFIVLEYCSNGDLNKVIEKHRRTNTRIPLKTIFHWILDAANGLYVLHSKNIIHRDIKPSNLFLTNDDRIKLGDLGVAKCIETTLRSSLNVASTRIGTYCYMSPEMLHLKSYSFKTDIWSIGCVLYELYNLKIAFPNPFENQSIESLDLKNSKFVCIIERSIRMNSQERFSSEKLVNCLMENEYDLTKEI